MVSFREYLQQLSEGVDDPGVLKCVFMAGGPGSGKSYAANKLFAIDERIHASFSSYGLKVINSDIQFERILKQHGVPLDLDTLEKEDPVRFQHAMALRQHAKRITDKFRTMYVEGRLGLIIDGTGRDYDDIKQQYNAAMAHGYDCYMVFVNTTKDTALERNRRRDRSVPENLVTQVWEECQRNVGKFQGLFGASNFLVVDSTDDPQQTAKALQSMGRTIHRWMLAPVKNRLGAKWIAMMGGRHR